MAWLAKSSVLPLDGSAPEGDVHISDIIISFP